MPTHHQNKATIMKLQPVENDELNQRRNQIAGKLTQACHNFVATYSAHGLTASEQTRFLEFLTKPYGIVQVSRHLRPVIIRMPNEALRRPIWDLIDAIGFWEDSHPDQWPYTRHDDFQRLLNWAEDYAINAFASVRNRSTAET
jgi:predicted P-loop ATPase